MMWSLDAGLPDQYIYPALRREGPAAGMLLKEENVGQHTRKKKNSDQDRFSVGRVKALGDHHHRKLVCHESKRQTRFQWQVYL